MFKVSDKVVCVDDSLHINHWMIPPPKWLCERKVYVIREIVSSGFEFVDGAGYAVRLVGVQGGIFSDGVEGCWTASRFRKLEEVREEHRKEQHESAPA